MYKVVFAKSYRKAMKRMARSNPRDISLIEGVVETLAEGSHLEPKYRNHMLTGSMHGFYECHVKPDLLLIYTIDRGNLVLVLVNAGSHADMFG